MDCKANSGFGDKERSTDLLQSEKHLAGVYNSCLMEAATPEVVSCLCELWQDTQSIQRQLFQEMNGRGWYPVTKAEDQKVNQAKMKNAVTVSH